MVRRGFLDLWWRRVGVVAIGLVLAAALMVAVWLLTRPMLLLLAALIIATAMAAPAGWLARWLPRTAAILVSYLLLVLVVGGIVAFLVTRLLAGAGGLIEIFPVALERAQAMIADWDPAIGAQVSRTVNSGMDRLAEGAAGTPLTAVISIFEVVVVLVMSVYWLIAADDLRRFTLSLFPPNRRDETESVLREMGETMGGFVRADVLDALIVGAIVYGGLLVIGLPFPFALAVVAAVGELIPLVGPYLAAVPILAVAVLGGPIQALATLALLVAVKQFEAYFLLPHLAKHEASIPPLLAIFALIAGASAGELLGALVAIPSAGALRVLVVRVIAPAIRRRTSGAADRPDGSIDAARRDERSSHAA